MVTRSSSRLDLGSRTPDTFGALHALASKSTERAVEAGLPPLLLELIRIRASQINGCEFCLAMHTEQARAAGERDDRLEVLAQWRDSALFSEPERAALDLAEAVTLVHDGHVSDEIYARASAYFDEERLAHLLWTSTLINAYNRLAVSTRAG